MNDENAILNTNVDIWSADLGKFKIFLNLFISFTIQHYKKGYFMSVKNKPVGGTE